MRKLSSETLLNHLLCSYFLNLFSKQNAHYMHISKWSFHARTEWGKIVQKKKCIQQFSFNSFFSIVFYLCCCSFFARIYRLLFFTTHWVTFSVYLYFSKNVLYFSFHLMNKLLKQYIAIAMATWQLCDLNRFQYQSE